MNRYCLKWGHSVADNPFENSCIQVIWPWATFIFLQGNKGPYTQSYGLSSSHVQIWELDHTESWVLKNWCFELWCWTRLLRVPWIARRSNQSILKEINPEYSSEGLMLKLKLQYFGHLMRRANSLQKTLMLGKIHYPGGSERPWSLLCYSPRCCKELDIT